MLVDAEKWKTICHPESPVNRSGAEICGVRDLPAGGCSVFNGYKAELQIRLSGLERVKNNKTNPYNVIFFYSLA